MEHTIDINDGTAAAANPDKRGASSEINGPPTRLSAIYMDSGEVHDRAQFSTLNFRNLNQREANRRETLSESCMYELRMARSGNRQAFSISSEAGESIQSQMSNILNTKSLDAKPPVNAAPKKSTIVVSKEINSGFLSGDGTTSGPCSNGNGCRDGNGNGYCNGDERCSQTPTNMITLLLLLVMFLGFGSVLVVFGVTFVKVRGYNLEWLSLVSIGLCVVPAFLICVWSWRRFWEGVNLRCGNFLGKPKKGGAKDGADANSSKLALQKGTNQPPV
ncbi:hypothetical protein BSKO_12230 [Bryopsis sp. KO-2023]|nr:hypothetical protein BSKO_12230 [Bryopsis sp. KO-2023]